MVAGVVTETGTDGQLNGSAGGKHSHTRSHPPELDAATKRTRCVRDVGERGDEPERRADRRLVLDPPADGGAVDEFWWIAIS